MAPLRDWKGRTYNFDFADPNQPVRTFRSRKPSHFIFEIDSYTKFKEALESAKLQVFETPQFTAGGIDWALRIYPKGNSSRGGAQHISLYLSRKTTDPTIRTSEVSVSMKFFIKDQISGEYLVIEDLGERSFDLLDTEWGIPKVIGTKEFEETSNGFVVEQKCTFGAEVYLTNGVPQYSKMSAVNNIPRRIHKVEFSITARNSESFESNTFTTKFNGVDYKWKLVLYKEGYGEGSNITQPSLYMILLDNDKLSGGRSMLVNFNLKIHNNDTGMFEHGTVSVLDWYTYSKDTAGYPEFMPTGYQLFSQRYNYVAYNIATVEVTINSVFLLNTI